MPSKTTSLASLSLKRPSMVAKTPTLSRRFTPRLPSSTRFITPSLSLSLSQNVELLRNYIPCLLVLVRCGGRRRAIEHHRAGRPICPLASWLGQMGSSHHSKCYEAFWLRSLLHRSGDGVPVFLPLPGPRPRWPQCYSRPGVLLHDH